MKIRAMQEEDYEKVYALWYEIKEFGLRSINGSFDNINTFLKRSPNLNAVAELEGEIIGSILCGHDGRTEGFYHACVRPNHRRKGIAHEMTKFCLEALKKEKTNKITFITFKSNDLDNEFWRYCGFILREDANYYDLSLNDDNQTNFSR